MDLYLAVHESLVGTIGEYRAQTVYRLTLSRAPLVPMTAKGQRIRPGPLSGGPVK